MANKKEKSASRTKTTGASVDIDKARIHEANEAVKKKVKEVVEKLGEIVRKAHGPPGTP